MEPLTSPLFRPSNFKWPEPPLNVVLFEPEIPQNTGNIARLCAATGSPLHLVGPLGFHITNSRLRRAGLDYWESVTMTRYASWEEFQGTEARDQRTEDRDQKSEVRDQRTEGQTWFFSTKGRIPYTAVRYSPGDRLVFGSESRGLPADLLAQHEDHVLTLPMQGGHVRSLNLANTVAIVLYEALRQMQKKT